MVQLTSDETLITETGLNVGRHRAEMSRAADADWHLAQNEVHILELLKLIS